MDDETKKELFTLGLAVGREIGARKVYQTIFKRLNRPDYDLYPGLYDYNKVKKILKREKLSFKSEGNKLNAYYYEAEGKSKDLVILVHGFHSGSDDYLPITMYLVSKGFNVFTYDGTGTYESEGKDLRGFLQGLVDLDHAIDFVKKNKKFKNQKLFLLGHSCGGFAVNAVINLHKKDINAVASLAAVNNCYTLILDKAAQYAGEFAEEGFQKEFLDRYQKKIFGKYVTYDALTGVNSVKIPIFIAHGDSDKTISYKEQSLISKRRKIKNPNVDYYTGKGNQGGHDSLWHSPSSNDYQELVNATIKKMKKDKASEEEIKEYISGIDHYLYSEIDYKLFDKIINTFQKNRYCTISYMRKHITLFASLLLVTPLFFSCTKKDGMIDPPLDADPPIDPPATIEEPLEMNISVSNTNRNALLSKITPTVTYTLIVTFNNPVKNIDNTQISVSFNEPISYEVRPVYYPNGADEPFGNSDASASYVYYFNIEDTSEDTCELSVEYEDLEESLTLDVLHNNFDGYILSYGSTDLYYGYGKLKDDDTKYLLFEEASSFHDYINSLVSSVSDTIFEKYNLLAIKINKSADTESIDFSSCHVENNESIVQIEERQKSAVHHWAYSEVVAWIAIEKGTPSDFTANIYYSYF